MELLEQELANRSPVAESSTPSSPIVSCLSPVGPLGAHTPGNVGEVELFHSSLSRVVAPASSLSLRLRGTERRAGEPGRAGACEPGSKLNSGCETLGKWLCFRVPWL